MLQLRRHLFPHGIYLLFIILSFVIGAYYTKYTTKEKTTTETRLTGNYNFINPLLECDNSAVSRDTNLDPLKKQLIKYIDNNNHSTSVYYRDMNNGPWFGIDEKGLFSPASLIKVPLFMAYLKKAEADPKILDKEIINTLAYDPNSQNIQPKVTLAVGQKYTVRALLEQMIIYSDDTSYNLLNKQMSAKEVVKVYDDLGVDISQASTNPTGNIISVKAYASFFRILFNASYLNPEMSEYALKVLGQSEFKDGLIAGLPKDIVAAHKFGERQYLDSGLKQLHDCGIVYLPQKPYLLCIMTRGNNFTTLEKNIKTISKLVYDTVSK